MDRKEMTRSLLVIAAFVLALVLMRSGPMGLRLAVDQAGISFQFNSSIAKVAFEIGQECAESNSGGLFR